MDTIKVSINDFYNPLTLEENYSKLDELRDKVKKTKCQIQIRRKLRVAMEDEDIIVPAEWRKQEEKELIERRAKNKRWVESMNKIGKANGISIDSDLAEDLPMPTEEQYKKKYIRQLEYVRGCVRDRIAQMNRGEY